MVREFVSLELKQLLVAGCAAFISATLLIGTLLSGSTKVLAAVLGGAVVLGGAYFSGNVRLFCLYGLTLTLPFDLSKRFGTVIEKMGGEIAFRVEVSDPFLFALAGFLLLDILRRRAPGLLVPKVTFLWMIIIVMGCLAVIFTEWRLTAAHEVVRMIKVTVLFLVICNELHSAPRILHCATGLTLGMIIQAITGLIQYVTGRRLGLDALGETSARTVKQLANSSVQGEEVFRISAFLVHPNVFGIFLAALIPLAVCLLLIRVGVTKKLIFATGALLGLPALIGTLSRSGWLSFATAFALLLLLTFFHQGLRRRSMLVTAAAIVGLTVVLALYSGPIVRRIFSSHEGAMLGRAEYNSDAWRMIAARPWLGFGLNSYVYEVPPYTRYGAREALGIYQGWIPAVHNIYLLWAAETGFIGLAIHLLMWGFIIGVGIGNLRVNEEVLFAINVACLCAMLAFIVDGFFSFSLRINSICRLFWVLSGVIMAIRYWQSRRAALAAGVPRQSDLALLTCN